MNHETFLVIRDIIVTAFQVWCLTLLTVNERCKHKGFFRFLFLAVITIDLVALSYYGMPILVKFTSVVILVVWLGKNIYDCPRSKLLFYGVVTILAEYCSELIVIQIWNWYNAPVYSHNIMYDDFVLTIVIMVNLIYFIIMFVLGKIIKSNKTKIQLKEVYPILVSGIPFLFVLTGLHISLPQIDDHDIRLWFMISSIGIFIAFIFNVMYMQNYLETIEKNKEEEHALDELKIKNEYYLQKLEAQERVKEVYHDLKNYFLLSDQETISKKIQKKLSLFERFYETGNDFLNIILAEKISRAYELGIQIECHVDFSKGKFIDPFDISTIFGNLLDNALEATQRINDEEKYIYVNVAVRRNLLVLMVKNNISESGEKELRTEKWNSSYHGYGLQNVRRSIKKYNGEIKINIEGKEFTVSGVIPIPPKDYD